MDLEKEFLQWDVPKTFMTLVNSVLLFLPRKSISPTTGWQKWRICQLIHLLVNWIWAVSLLGDICIHPCAHELTHTLSLPLPLSLSVTLTKDVSKPYSFFLYPYMIMSMKNIHNKRIMVNCIFPMCIILNMPILRQQIQRDQWSWAMLQAHPSQPGTQQDLEDQRPGRSASHTPLPCESHSITVRNMMSALSHTQTLIHTVHPSTYLQTWILNRNLIWLFFDIAWQ